MASVHIKTGASGGASPYWNAKLKGPDGTGWTLTTKLREKKLALRLARLWETAAEVARNGHLTHEKAQKFLTECEDITRGGGLKKSAGVPRRVLAAIRWIRTQYLPYPGKVFS
jgi:hypothetical protein